MTDIMSKIKIAVFGTTSSGKSTFLNLLVGAELLPSGVQETTLGQVVIQDGRKRLLSMNTGGAEADLFENPRAYEVCETLTERFESLRAQGIVCTQSPVINWPTRIGTHLRRAGMRGAAIELVDSPGLRFIGDERHPITLGEDPLVVFVFGADETDTHKQFNLLRQVLEQVNDPTRILFVLNKVDIFFSDYDPLRSEQRLQKSLVRKIHAELKERWANAARPTLIGVSARSAHYANIVLEASRFRMMHLVSCRARKRSRKQAHRALIFLLKHHRVMIPDELLDALPRDVSEFSADQRKEVIDVLLLQARDEDFQRELLSRLQPIQRQLGEAVAS